MAERPRVVGVCRWIRGIQPDSDFISAKVRPDGISSSFCCDCRLPHAVNLLLDYSQSGLIVSSNVIWSHVIASLAMNETTTNLTVTLPAPSWSLGPP